MWGNIHAAIDFSDVRDIVEAYRLIMEKAKKARSIMCAVKIK